MFKRYFDVTMSAFVLFFLSPILLLVGVFIYCRDGRPVLFCQFRIGRKAKPFVLYKFQRCESLRIPSLIRSTLGTVLDNDGREIFAKDKAG